VRTSLLSSLTVVLMSGALVCAACEDSGSRTPGNDDPTDSGPMIESDAVADSIEGDTVEMSGRWDDGDGDGVPNGLDNCPGARNSEQTDTDEDGRGDACDNCPETPNFPQANEDGDDTGDACEAEPAGPICQTLESDFEVIEPNIYIVVDRSSSMTNQDGVGSSRMERAKAGLDQVATALADQVRLGMSTYPCGGENDACDTLNYEILPIGEHTATEFRESYGPSNFTDSTCPGGDGLGLDGLDVEEGGMHLTETGAALRDVLNRGLYEGANPDDRRKNRIVLITDGNACGCGDNGCQGDQDATISSLNDLRANGVLTYVVGFNFDSQLLNDAAEAGGTNAMRNGKRYFDASNPSELVDALEDIRDRTISCNYDLDPAPPAANKLWVEVDGDYISQSETDGYSYDADSQTLTINGGACDTLQNADTDTIPLEVEMGCACEEPPCACQPNGESCSADAECCKGVCDEGTCEDQCYPLGTTCQTNSQCCSDNCTTGDESKQCFGG